MSKDGNNLILNDDPLAILSTDGEQWIGPEALAALVEMPVATVYAWRQRGVGPVGYKIGRHVRYRVQDVNAWLDQCRDPRPQVQEVNITQPTPAMPRMISVEVTPIAGPHQGYLTSSPPTTECENEEGA